MTSTKFKLNRFKSIIALLIVLIMLFLPLAAFADDEADDNSGGNDGGSTNDVSTDLGTDPTGGADFSLTNDTGTGTDLGDNTTGDLGGADTNTGGTDDLSGGAGDDSSDEPAGDPDGEKGETDSNIITGGNSNSVTIESSDMGADGLLPPGEEVDITVTITEHGEETQAGNNKIGSAQIFLPLDFTLINSSINISFADNRVDEDGNLVDPSFGSTWDTDQWDYSTGTDPISLLDYIS